MYVYIRAGVEFDREKKRERERDREIFDGEEKRREEIPMALTESSIETRSPSMRRISFVPSHRASKRLKTTLSLDLFQLEKNCAFRRFSKIFENLLQRRRKKGEKEGKKKEKGKDGLNGISIYRGESR